MSVNNGYVMYPSIELLPDYKLSPFQTQDIIFNRNLPSSDQCDSYFDYRFGKNKYLYTLNGRSAINYALKQYRLETSDCITILTTSGNYYISSCVTKEIEKFCSWSRTFQKNTKLIFVNHEFGYPFENIENLRKYKLPIIEDCAYSFYSVNTNTPIIGDYAIFSFPKIFPMQIGGLLVTGLNKDLNNIATLESSDLRHMKNSLSYYLQYSNDIIKTRLYNYKLLRQKLTKLGISERFKLKNSIVPGVFLLQCNLNNLRLDELKKHFYNHGIQCSVFYGEAAFFLPIHQKLHDEDFNYFYYVFKAFLDI